VGIAFRSFARRPTFASLCGSAAAALIRVVRYTSTTLEPADLHAKFAIHQPFILAMWHGQFMMLPGLTGTDFKVCAVVSRHGDGEIIAATLRQFGIELIRGAGAGSRKKTKSLENVTAQAYSIVRAAEFALGDAAVPARVNCAVTSVYFRRDD
jgi:lysophospholipid acyltransferase (LPLAT)-like uncharacterized protein